MGANRQRVLNKLIWLKHIFFIPVQNICPRLGWGGGCRENVPPRLMTGRLEKFYLSPLILLRLSKEFKMTVYVGT